jgi:IclR family acetate operon transcriptional repressor
LLCREQIVLAISGSGSIFDELAGACASIRAKDYSLDEAEHIAEARCVAAPVRYREGKIVAAIGVSAPAARLSKKPLSAAIRRVTEASTKITEVLSA